MPPKKKTKVVDRFDWEPLLNPLVSPLLTDLYQITMAYAYWNAGRQNKHSTFDLFFRKNPFKGGYTIFAGLQVRNN